jgi:hypothetical protein
MIIEIYNSSKDIWVRFIEGNYLKHTSYRDFKKGEVRSPYDRTIHGIGYFGEGEYTTFENGRKNKYYQAWKNMLDRCYDEKLHQKMPTYKDVTVCEEWLNFQNYAKFYSENHYIIEGETMVLDKDILVKGNKIYSPDTCIFIPQSINLMFTKCDKARGDLPIGVSFNKLDKKYVSQCRTNGKTIVLGRFDNPEDAFAAYKIYKEKLIKKKAKELKNQIPGKLYEAMLRYEVEIND